MAEVILKQANLSEIPLRVLATLPAALPSAGYANLLCKDTVDGKRAYLRLPDGSLVNLFTVNTETTIDNTIDNTITNNNTVYQIDDLPAPSGLGAGAIPLTVTNVLNQVEWGWTTNIAELLVNRSIQANRSGNIISASKTLALSDADLYLSTTAAATLTLSSAVAWPVWSEFEIARNTSGAVVIAPSGVTINGASANITISKENGLVVLKCIGLNTFRAYGDIS